MTAAVGAYIFVTIHTAIVTAIIVMAIHIAIVVMAAFMTVHVAIVSTIIVIIMAIHVTVFAMVAFMTVHVTIVTVTIVTIMTIHIAVTMMVGVWTSHLRTMGVVWTWSVCHCMVVHRATITVIVVVTMVVMIAMIVIVAARNSEIEAGACIVVVNAECPSSVENVCRTQEILTKQEFFPLPICQYIINIAIAQIVAVIIDAIYRTQATEVVIVNFVDVL